MARIPIKISQTIFDLVEEKHSLKTIEDQREYIGALIKDIIRFCIFLNVELNHKQIFQIFGKVEKDDYTEVKISIGDELYRQYQQVVSEDKNIKNDLCFFEFEQNKEFINQALRYLIGYHDLKVVYYEKIKQKYKIEIDGNIDLKDYYIFTNQQLENYKSIVFKLGDEIEKKKQYDKTDEIKRMYIHMLDDLEVVDFKKKRKLIKKYVFEKENIEKKRELISIEILKYYIRMNENIEKIRSTYLQKQIKKLNL